MRYQDFLQQLRTHYAYETPAGSRWPIISLPLVRRFFFYGVFIYTVFATRWQMARGVSAMDAVMHSSFVHIWSLERAGGVFRISGLEHIANATGAVVINANHMSTLETLVLPSLVMPFRPCSFVVKQSLIKYPLFGKILERLGALAVSRENARADLQQVLKRGKEMLQEGTSLVIFPQSTRMREFDGSKFGSLGVKLARSADVVAIPAALKTDVLVNGRYVKDLCGIDPRRKAYFAFGPAMKVEGKGHEEHEAIIAFISRHVEEWRAAEATS